MNSQNIQSVLVEERSFTPSPEFTAEARLKPEDVAKLRADATSNYKGFWARQAQTELRWHKPFTQTLDESKAPNYRWFTDGELNVSFNCLDVNLEERGHKTAVTFVGEPGDVRHVSYRELHADVCRFANGLASLGVKAGDRVVIYMPMVPEAIVAMHACARIGAIHSVVFGGFSALSLKDRIEDAGAKVVITADGGWRGGKIVELKEAADKALSGGGGRSVRRVVVLKRTGHEIPMKEGRDLWWHDVIEGQSPVCDPVWVNAEHPLFLLYTSGSTGKPKGIQHSSAGYLLGAKLTSKWVFDLNDKDVFWCTADIGWVTGHSYVAYGPLAAGATIVIYEGAPTFPHAGRFWQICESLGVTIFYTAPTAIRALMKLGDDIPARYDLTKLRLLGSVGEPINPEAWMWYHENVGRMRCPIVDTWWQTETGAIMMSPIPGVTATKPGSCTQPLPGIDAAIVDAQGNEVQGEAGGFLVIRKPWPSMLRTIWGDNARYVSTYWEAFKNRYYVAGDSAHRDKDGYFWIMGRIDDVLNVAGHRLGTMEIESALVAHPKVAEAAVVGKPHEIKGESVFAYVVLRGERPTGEKAQAFEQALRAHVSEQLGAIARPDDIRFSDNLPKTRSGKIMRRLLRAIARNEDITQDLSTLENPAIIEQLRGNEAAMPATPVAAAPAPEKTAQRGEMTAQAKAPAKKKAAPVKVKVKAKSKAKAKTQATPKPQTKAKARFKAKAKVKLKKKSARAKSVAKKPKKKAPAPRRKK